MTIKDQPNTAPKQVMPSIPGYEVLCELGRGGMGVVYKARSLVADRLVALKMILGAGSPRFLQFARFCLEAQAVACLSHPNIVKIYDVGEFGGYPFYTFEYASGGNLAERIQGQPQSPRWSAEVAKILVEALDHAHRRDILHRDLKPSNILLMETGVPKITDFGLVKFSRSVWDVSRQYETISVLHKDIVPLSALWEEEDEEMRLIQFGQDGAPIMGKSFEEWELKKLCEKILGSFGADAVTRGCSTLRNLQTEWERQAGSAKPEGLPRLDDLTRPGEIMGSPHYMAPEQTYGDNRRIGPQTDLYSLGAILYQVLTGRRPFEGSSMSELLERVRTQRPEPIQPKVSRDLEAIVLRCMEKRIERRYPSASELADDLQRFLDGYAVLAPEPGVEEAAETIWSVPAPPETRSDPTVNRPTSTSRDTRKTGSGWQFWR